MLKDIDSKKQGSLNYNDFCKWMGGAIHKSEGFYFRHDSIKNPIFEQKEIKREMKEEITRRRKMTAQEVEKAIVKKIEFQWKTLKSAFSHLDLHKNGKVGPDELKHFFNHWGFRVEEDQFM